MSKTKVIIVFFKNKIRTYTWISSQQFHVVIMRDRFWGEFLINFYHVR